MANHTEFLNTKYFKSLNGIRCLAIIFVIGFHYAGLCSVLGIMNFSLTEIFLRGYLGVNLFFVVSGFLITTLLLREQQLQERISIKAFYIRRMLRIFPLYYAVLIIYAVRIFTADTIYYSGMEFFQNLPFYLTFTSNWFVLNPSAIFIISWSLATEEQFYFIWPLVLNAFKKSQAVLLIVSVIILNQLYIFNIFGPVPFLSEIQNLFLSRIMTSISTPICLGALLAFGLNSKELYEQFIIFKSKLISVIALSTLIFLIYVPLQLTPVWVLAISFGMMLFVGSCVYQEGHGLAPILNSKVFNQIGMVSYGMYLFHLIVIFEVHNFFGFMHWMNPDFEFLVSLIMTFIIAVISFYCYESRFVALKRRLR